jgi:predicted nucleotidyltransferase
MAESLDLSEWSRRDEAVARAAAARAAHVAAKVPLLRRILSEYGVGVAYLFGSAAQGDLRPDSDVDVAVGHCPPESFYRLAAALERALELPLDLLDLDRAPPDFVAEIKRTGRIIHPVPRAAP